MPSEQHNSTMAKATALIFSSFDVSLAQEVPFGIPQYTKSILNGHTSVLLCVHSSLLTKKNVDFVGGMFLSQWKSSILIIMVFTLITKELFEQLLVHTTV